MLVRHRTPSLCTQWAMYRQLHRNRLLRSALLHCSSARLRPSGASSIARNGLGRVLKPFENVNIYNAGTIRTTIVGFTRVATVFILLFGTVAIAPRFMLDPTCSPWFTPLVILGCATPMLVTTVASAPYVSNIRLVLPSYVKRSQSAIEAFSRRMPPDTKIVLQTMRFIPWPMHREVRFDQLRRLPESKWRSANLEVNSSEGQGSVSKTAKSADSWIVKRLYQRYYIDREQAVDRSALPGVLDTVWQQIPFQGEPRRPVTSTASVPKPALTDSGWRSEKIRPPALKRSR